jgi:hypothetical protein
LADEHKTVLLSIFATVLAGFIIFLATVAISGGISISLIKGYVLPLFISAFTLAVFAGVLFARNKGMIPGMAQSEPPLKEPKEPEKSA